jgi:transcriptional regulator with XRE-family HTH domain
MKTYDSFLHELLQDKEFFDEYYKNHYREEIGIQLIQFRVRRGLTQSQLAEKANTTQTVVSRLENATVKPSLETVRKLAHALNAILEINLVAKEELLAENAMNSLIDYSPKLAERLSTFSKTHESKVPTNQIGTWISIEQGEKQECILEV